MIGAREFAAVALASLVSAGASLPALGFKEIEVQERYCAGMPINRQLPGGVEVDCITDEYGIEVDFTDHWAQAIGQALYYASELERRPAVILVCNEGVKADTCLRHRRRFVDAVTYWRIGMYLWYCDSEADQRLDDCAFEDLFGPD